MQQEQLVNLAIQILPQEVSKTEAYRLVDAAIEAIEASGLKHVVCPFETVVEGTYDEVMAVLETAQQAAFDAGASSLLVNMKLHRSASGSQFIADKMEKYEDPG